MYVFTLLLLLRIHTYIHTVYLLGSSAAISRRTIKMMMFLTLAYKLLWYIFDIYLHTYTRVYLFYIFLYKLPTGEGQSVVRNIRNEYVCILTIADDSNEQLNCINAKRQQYAYIHMYIHVHT
ncbi:unnamed protein product [Ceratitis capitata]|uniref:(Mediterranean fruit fly) hypothetical protein n=1 Tax=Ceratitis capitata TaxID=7213 RepID=A0A811ULK2_CERCA|nr:unnamed protein product [Ceratitis capitata]